MVPMPSASEVAGATGRHHLPVIKLGFLSSFPIINHRNCGQEKLKGKARASTMLSGRVREPARERESSQTAEQLAGQELPLP